MTNRFLPPAALYAINGVLIIWNRNRNYKSSMLECACLSENFGRSFFCASYVVDCMIRRSVLDQYNGLPSKTRGQYIGLWLRHLRLGKKCSTFTPNLNQGVLLKLNLIKIEYTINH